MQDSNQIFVPESFLDLYRDRSRQRLTESIARVRDRHELCEDLAQHLVAAAQQLHFDHGISEDEVLIRCEAGLQTSDSGLSRDESTWTVRRLAELLHWN